MKKGFRKLTDTMSRTDALKAAAVRMDNVAGAMEIFEGIIDTVQLSLGQALLPVLRLFIDQLIVLADQWLPAIEQAFGRFSTAITNVVVNTKEGMSPLNLLTQFMRDMGFPKETIDSVFAFVEGLDDIIERAQEIITPITDAVEQFVSWQDILVVIGISIAATVIPIIITLMGILYSVVAPILILIGIVALLRKAWETDFAGIRDFVAGIWTAITTAWDAFKLLFTGDWDGFLLGIREAWETAWTAAAEFIGNLWDIVRPHLVEFALAAYAWFIGVDWTVLGIAIRDGITNVLTELWSKAEPILIEFGNSTAAWFDSVPWAELGTTVVTGISTGLDTFGAMVETKMLEWFPKITEPWERIKLFIAEAWATILIVVGAVMAVLGPAIDTFVSGASEALGEFDTLLPALGELWEALKPVVIFVLKVIVVHAIITLGAVVSMFNGIAKAIGPFIEGLIKMVTNIIEIFTGIVNFVVGFFELIIAIFKNDGDAVEAAWKKMGDGLMSIVIGFVSFINNAITWLVETVTGLVGGMIEGIITFFDALIDPTAASMEEVKTSVSGGWGDVGITTETAMIDIGASTDTGWSNVATSADTAMLGMGTGVDTGFAGIEMSVSTAMANMETASTTGWTGMETGADTSMVNLAAVVDTGWTGMETSTDTAIANMGAVVDTGFVDMETSATTGTGNIESLVDTSWLNMEDLTATSFGNMESSVDTGWLNMEDLTSTGAGNIEDITDTSMINMESTVSTGFGDIEDTYANGWDEVIEIFEDADDAILDLVEETTAGIIEVVEAVDWPALGDSIAEGIAAGIARGSGKIIAAAKSAAQAALAAAKAELGIASPSTVMAEQVGKPASAGIAVGITDNIHLITNAMKAAADAIGDSEGLKKFAQLVKTVSDAVIAVIEAIAEVSRATFPKDFGNKFLGLNHLIMFMVNTMESGGAVV